MRRQSPDQEQIRQPLKFSIGSDEEDDGKPALRSSSRQGADTPSRPTLIHVRIIGWLLRAFPRILIFLFCASVITAMIPGGWRVGLCAANLLPPPVLRRGENVTLIGHRGCEFPYPENTLQALRYGAELLRYVELDVALTSDQHAVLMHDHTLDRTTNGTGVTCTKSLEYIKSLEVSMPERDPRGRIAQAKHCTYPNAAGQSVPCTYRVPTLSDIFDDLPVETKFMIDVKECYAPGIQATSEMCSNCSVLLSAVKKAMKDNFVRPDRVTFTSAQPASLKVFREGMPAGSYFSLGLNQKFSHYKKVSLMDMIATGNYTSASLYLGLAAIRPDFVRTLRESPIPGTMKHRDAFAWTIRRDVDFRLARCAGISKLIVAEPKKMLQRTGWGISSLIAEDP